MIRSFAFAIACLAALPASAQTATATPEIARASRALGAIWRPLDGPVTGEAITTACAGAEQEMQALDAAMPAELSADSAARVRGLRGLHIVLIEDAPGAAYFFPPLGMDWFTSGLGAFSVIDEGEGFIGVRDAAGLELAFQLGRAGRHPMLRIRKPDGALLTLAGCQPIAPIEGGEG
jgi:hypothetical protein